MITMGINKYINNYLYTIVLLTIIKTTKLKHDECIE